MKSVQEIQDYWKKPNDGSNNPEGYFKGAEKSHLILQAINALRLMQPSILELGCNVGRNLTELHKWHYTDLHGIEINQEAIEKGQKENPYLQGRITHGAIEEVLPSIPDSEYDVVFTMAVLEHIHPVSGPAIFREMVRVTKRYLITIEDETLTSWRHFPRKYDRIFMPLGMTQIKQKTCSLVPGLGPRFMMRIFKKQ